MPPTSEFPFRRVYFSPSLLATLPEPVRTALGPLLETKVDLSEDTARTLAVLHASEVIREAVRSVPAWVDAETSYLIVTDVPEPALLQLPTILRVHKPDQRIHVSRDLNAAKRQAVALVRDHVFEGIVDAYVLWSDLYVVLGDMSVRCFPFERLTFLARLDETAIGDFVIHSSGSYLHWPATDLRVGASQLLQAVDPTFLADVIVERYSLERVSLALRILRERRSLTQSAISGLSARHIRRLEKEEVRLTSDAAVKYAAAFGTSIGAFLDELGQCIEWLDGGVTANELMGAEAEDGRSQVRHVS